MILLGIAAVIYGIYQIYSGILKKKFYEKLEKGYISEYNKTVGVVICDAYDADESTKLNKAVTPIVEYEVDGEKYEASNSILKTGAELPVGTKMYVWYKKDKPEKSVLGSNLNVMYDLYFTGSAFIVFGLIFILMFI